MGTICFVDVSDVVFVVYSISCYGGMMKKCVSIAKLIKIFIFSDKILAHTEVAVVFQPEISEHREKSFEKVSISA